MGMNALSFHFKDGIPSGYSEQFTQMYKYSLLAHTYTENINRSLKPCFNSKICLLNFSFSFWTRLFLSGCKWYCDKSILRWQKHNHSSQLHTLSEPHIPGKVVKGYFGHLLLFDPLIAVGNAAKPLRCWWQQADKYFLSKWLINSLPYLVIVFHNFWALFLSCLHSPWWLSTEQPLSIKQSISSAGLKAANL